MVRSPDSGRRGARLARDVAELMRLGLPVVVARLGVMTMALVDTVMVGRFASDELAFLSIALVPLNPMIITALGLLLGTLVLTSEVFGAGREPACGAVWRRSLGYAAAIGAAGLVVSTQGAAILGALGQSETLSAEGGRVMLVLGLGLPANLIYLTTAFFLEGIKRPLPGMVMMVAANLLNIALNWLLVYGQFGLPAMGAMGSAWATTILRFGLAIAVCSYVWTMADHARFGIRGRIEADRPAWNRQRRIGYAAAASIGTESAAFAVLGIFAGWLGSLALAAFSIALNVVAIVFMVALGFAGATAVRVAAARGREDPHAVARAGWQGLAVNSAVMAAIGTLLLFAAPALAGFYTLDPDLRILVTPLIAFVAFVLVADGGQAVMANALRGRGETWFPTGLHILSYVGVMAPAGWLLALPLDRGVSGLFEAILIASLVSVSLLSLRFAWLARADRRIAEADASSRGGS
ncbi:MAG: MATE family efflux transporter [Alphaproteobacteria bacterium]|nr:MATE family efflux transporter [Alphaproteobacteria bacterium]